MSNLENDLLIGRVGELLDLAAHYAEEFTNTTVQGVIEAQVAQLAFDVDCDNLDDVFNVSMPALERTLNDCSETLAQLSQEHFYTEYGETF